MDNGKESIIILLKDYTPHFCECVERERERERETDRDRESYRKEIKPTKNNGL